MDGGAWKDSWDHWGSDTTERLPFHFSLSCTGEGNGTPLQCSCLENPRDGGAWWALVYGVTQSQTRLKQLSSSSSIFIWLTSSAPALNFFLWDNVLCLPESLWSSYCSKSAPILLNQSSSLQDSFWFNMYALTGSSQHFSFQSTFNSFVPLGNVDL